MTCIDESELLQSSKGDTFLAGGTGVVDDVPRSVRWAAINVITYSEGFVYPKDPEFCYRFGVRYDPRTLAGVAPNGSLLSSLWARSRSLVRANFIESVAYTKALWPRKLLIATMVVLGPALANRSSNTTGERRIDDTITTLP